MQYRHLGHSGLRVSVVSLGSWLTYGHSVSQDVTNTCIRTALDLGINLIDTADVYALGKCEAALGEALAEVPRKDYALATKVFFPTGDGPNDRGLSRKHMVESLHASLRRLRTEIVDVYQCHRFDETTPIAEVVRTMDDFIRQGKIFYWGVSQWPAQRIVEAVRIAHEMGAAPPISNQPCYNMLERGIEEEVLPVCANLGIGQIVYSPLCQGLLTGKYRKGSIPGNTRAADRTSNQFIMSRMTDENHETVDRLRAVREDFGIPMAAMALAWALRRPGIVSTIVGASRPEQVVQNAAAADIELTDEQITRIEAALRG